MNDREFINALIKALGLNAKEIDPYKITLNNAVANRLNDIADKLEKQDKVLSILKRIIKVKPSALYEFELVIRGTDEEENTIKEWLK